MILQDVEPWLLSWSISSCMLTLVKLLDGHQYIPILVLDILVISEPWISTTHEFDWCFKNYSSRPPSDRRRPILPPKKGGVVPWLRWTVTCERSRVRSKLQFQCGLEMNHQVVQGLVGLYNVCTAGQNELLREARPPAEVFVFPQKKYGSVPKNSNIDSIVGIHSQGSRGASLNMSSVGHNRLRDLPDSAIPRIRGISCDSHT